jgi:hypothetical protein
MTQSGEGFAPLVDRLPRSRLSRISLVCHHHICYIILR